MGKYTPLETYLSAIPTSQRELTLGFVQIERIMASCPPRHIFIRHGGRTKQKERLMLNHSHGWMQAGELTQ